MRRFPLILFVFMSLLTSHVHAQNINDDGAKRLKDLFTKQIESRQTKANNKGEEIRLDGDIMVEQADTYYAVTLPTMTTIHKDGSKSEVGLVAINATPTDTPENWTMAISIPSPILVKDENNKIIKQIDIGAQNMGGLWNGTLEGFSKLTASYNDIKVTNNLKSQIITLGNVDLAINLNETNNNKWSGPTKLTLKNVREENQNSKKMLKLDEAEFLIELDNFSLQKQMAAIDKMVNDQNEEESSESISGTIFQNMGNSFGLKAIFKGISMVPESKKAEQYKMINLGNAMLALTTKDLNTDKVQQTISFSYNELKPEKMNGVNDPLIPEEGSFNLTLNNIPLRGVIGLAEKVAPSTDVSNPSSRQVAAMQTMMTLPNLLTNAGTILTLSETTLSNNIYSTALNGTLKANTASLFGATGEMYFSIKNIDDVIKTLKDNNMETDHVTKLEAVKEICAKQGEGKEQSTVCHFILNENAKLTVNGQDMSVFLKALSGEKTNNSPANNNASKPEDKKAAR